MQTHPHKLRPPLPTQAHPRVSRPAQLCSEAVEMSGLWPPDQCPHPPHPRPWAGDPGATLAGWGLWEEAASPYSCTLRGPGPHPSPASRQAVCSSRPAQKHTGWSWGHHAHARPPAPPPHSQEMTARWLQPESCVLEHSQRGPAGLRAWSASDQGPLCQAAWGGLLGRPRVAGPGAGVGLGWEVARRGVGGPGGTGSG